MTADAWRTAEETARSAVERWLRHPIVRPAVESSLWRDGGSAALEGLERAVGSLDGQLGVSWLILAATGNVATYRDGSTWPVPGWSELPEAAAAAAALLKVVSMLAVDLSAKDVPLDPGGIADRVVLAQLITLEGWDWADARRMAREQLNVGASGSVRLDGRGISMDHHAGDRDGRALLSIKAQRTPKIRRQHRTKYDDAIRAARRGRPGTTAKELFDENPDLPGMDTRTAERRLKKIDSEG